MAEIERIDVEAARRKAQAGEALLVCAYNDEQKCDRMKLDGALTLAELRRRVSALPKEQEIIFYCG